MISERDLTKIKIISVNVLGSQLAYHLSYQSTEPIDFMGDGTRTDGETIFLNTSKNKYKDLVYLNLHELLHVLLEHIRRGKIICRDSIDMFLWNLATDHVIYYILNDLLSCNDILKQLKLSEIHNRLFRFKSDWKDYPAEVVFRMIKRNTKVITISSAKDIKKLMQELEQKGFSPQGKPREDINRNGKELATDASQKKFRDKCKNYGIETLTTNKEIKFAKVNLDFTKKIQNYISSSVTSGCTDVTFMKRNRLNYSLENLDVLLPKFVSYKLDAVFAIDTSGSISDSLYKRFLGIILSNMKKVDGDIVFCDTEIKKVVKIASECPSSLSKINKRYGQGGTDFDPVFEYTKKHRKRLLVYMTDLCASIPDYPSFKVVWVVPLSEKNYIKNVPYGKLIWC